MANKRNQALPAGTTFVLHGDVIIGTSSDVEASVTAVYSSNSPLERNHVLHVQVNLIVYGNERRPASL